MSSPESNPPQLPFRAEDFKHLGEADEASRVYEYKPNPETVMRLSSSFAHNLPEDDEKAFELMNSLSQDEKKMIVFNNIKEAKELFSEIEDSYGIKTAGFSPAVVEDDLYGRGELVVSKKINGKTIGETDNLSPDEKVAGRELLYKLTSYITEKSKSGEPFLSDISPLRQYVLQEDSNEFVLVDMDPFVDACTPERLHSFAFQLEEWAVRVLEDNEYSVWRDHLYKQLPQLVLHS